MDGGACARAKEMQVKVCCEAGNSFPSPRLVCVQCRYTGGDAAGMTALTRRRRRAVTYKCTAALGVCCIERWDQARDGGCGGGKVAGDRSLTSSSKVGRLKLEAADRSRSLGSGGDLSEADNLD